LVSDFSVWRLGGEVGRDMARQTLLGLGRRCNGRRRRHGGLEQGLRELLNPLQVERVEQLEGENDLVQLGLAIATGEYS